MIGIILKTIKQAPQQALRKARAFTAKPTGCRGCGAVRAAVGKVIGKPRARSTT